MRGLRNIEDGVTAPNGFSACGLHAGIKLEEPDMSLLVSDVPANAVAMFTKNRLIGAHISICRERIKSGKAQAVVINSGNANACTGGQGISDSSKMAGETARLLRIDEDLVYPCSTGLVGMPLPMETILQGINRLTKNLSREGGRLAAEGILTTDTVRKEKSIELEIGRNIIRIGAMAKGAGMIEPNMATMLAFLTTDASVSLAALQACLSSAVDMSFNRISIDGDQSCNDMVMFMANGKAKNPPLCAGSEGWEVFSQAVQEICLELAHMIVADGEGSTKFITICVREAASKDEADRAARSIANSLLVKTAIYGQNARTISGRVLIALGYSRVRCDFSHCDLFFNDEIAVLGGVSVESKEKIKNIVSLPRYTLNLKLHQGKSQSTIYTCDCSEAYVKLNM